MVSKPKFPFNTLSSQIRLRIHEILFLEALKDYTRIVTRNKKYYVNSNLGMLLREKAFNTFLRIHRSYAVQKILIDKVTLKSVFINDIELPIGRTYRESVQDARNL